MTERDVTAQITLRPVQTTDAEVLYAIYASTRSAEMAMVDWDDAQKEVFLRHQFNAQQVHYQSYYPEGDHQMILLDDAAIGRIYLDRSDTRIHVLDIAVLPDYRGRGIGNSLMQQVLAEADAAGLPTTLHIYRFDQAVFAWYQRLGFVVIGGSELYYLMERPRNSMNIRSI